MGECLLLTTCGWISIALICSIDSVLAQVFIGSVVVEKSAAMAYLNTACLNADGGTEKGVWGENLRARPAVSLFIAERAAIRRHHERSLWPYVGQRCKL